VPVLILTIAEDFDKLLENGILTSLTALCKFGRIVIMAVHVAFVLVVTIFGSELCRADGTREMLNMVLPVQGGDVGTSKGTATRMAEEI
jgi:hypothetical protein